MRLNLTLLTMLALTTLLVGCGEDHRTEDFCSMLCACSADAQDVEFCTTSCTGQLDAADESDGMSLISDECFACVNNTSCSRVQTACASDCSALEDVGDDQPPPEPVPGEL